MPDPVKNGYHTTVTSKNGTYSVGMTKSQAKANDSYSAWVGIDYKDLDKDGNGVLSQREILEGRVKIADRVAAGYTTAGNIATAMGVVVSVGSYGSLAPVAACTSGYAAGVMYGNAINEEKSARDELNRFKGDRAAQQRDQRYIGDF